MISARLHSGSSGANRGFTLIELLVATVVLALLCVFLFSLIDNSTRMWRTQEGQEDVFRQARAALNIVSRDLRNVVPTRNADWFLVESNRFAFLTSQSEKAQRTNDLSDICAVGYRLEWGRTDVANLQEKESMALYRYVRFSNPTFQRQLDAPNVVAEIFDQVDGTTTVREVVAGNILSIRVVPYSTNAAGDAVPFDPGVTGDTPDMIDLSLTSIGENAASRLTSQDQWAETNAPIIQGNQQTFSLRLHLPRPVPPPLP